MKITINIKTDNAAFEDYENELETILNHTANAISLGGDREGNLHDSNGNTCGSFKVTGK
jgi:hypothetical protein